MQGYMRGFGGGTRWGHPLPTRLVLAGRVVLRVGAVTKDELSVTPAHGPRNQLGSVHLPLSEQEAGRAGGQKRTRPQGNRPSLPAARAPRPPPAVHLARRRVPGRHTLLPPLLAPRFAVRFHSGSAEVAVVPPPPPPREANRLFYTKSRTFGRYGCAARATKPRSPDARPSSLPEGRIRGSRGAVLRLHWPVRLRGLRGPGAREFVEEASPVS
ncbi:tetratricopeptide repeat protein 32 isoform X1 [Canis lupus dingo]|uniref:tetratricopeptide repeat protein 32 isoform X1 n=1 Tax=Canis lupus dingo TaxID=286419 RepID=UPI0020C1C892|nr:tetratricopeptide repeat protein 32 isoform X1 [Canis lupus dingo]XP_048951262.1 tetratricopeptide repeat protein 32 isoform X1 [Canis lupus dingo]XP_048951263.1 tetratricopeptide repeat protein 32 isoform X1 [Canis lupus dingo]XP_048951264.1 tetratricopeptide repeat protein 32 isoform X1 [Canis lupus dingo]XP_048951266.1 tetratricopeptide repeat protein 32 isoform X1 [Canis lupus dingo]